MKKTIVALTLAAASTFALAQNSGFYAGGGVGISTTQFKGADFSFGIAAISESKDRSVFGWKAFGGYNFNQNWAVESGYSDLGAPKYKYAGTGALTGWLGQAKADQTALYVAGKGTHPVNNEFNLFIKLGLTANHLKTSLDSNIPGVNGSWSKTRTEVLYGLGAEYVPVRNVGVRLEWENYGRFGSTDSTGRTTADLWTLGVNYKF